MLLASLATEATHVDAWLPERIDQRLDRVRFSVSWWTSENRTAAPGNCVTFVRLTRVEEPLEIVLDILFQRVAQDQVVERGALDFLEEFFVLLEKPF